MGKITHSVMGKALALFAGAGMALAGLVAVPATANAADDYYTPTHVEFEDASQGFTPHYNDIIWLASKGVTTGYPDGTFGGMRDVVRQDMAVFLYRLAGTPAADTSKLTFSDVDRNSSQAKAIAWMAEQGLAKGYPDGTFGGMRTVVRQDMAAFLHRYAVAEDINLPLGAGKTFKDVVPGVGHDEDVIWLSRTGITKGYDDGTFGGMRTVVRQDMAAFLARVSGVTDKQAEALERANFFANVTSMHMSKAEVAHQLEFGGHSSSDAQFAADNVRADWNLNALNNATELAGGELRYSRQYIYNEMTESVAKYGDGFTKAQVEYALSHVKADWKANALYQAKKIKKDNPKATNAEIRKQLTTSSTQLFTAEEADYAIQHL